MTTRIVDFSDSVTSEVTPEVNVPTGPQGVPGQAFQLDETGVTFTETERARIELFGTPGAPSTHGLVTKTNPYVILIIIDSRTDAQRTAGPTELNRDLSRHVIEWNGITSTTNPNASTWFDYGEFTAIDSSKWISADGVPTASVGVDSDMYLDTGVTIPADAGKVYGPKANGTWPESTLNIAAGGLTTVDTDGEGLGGNGSSSTPLFLELNGSTLEKSATGLKLGATFDTRLQRYPTPATDGTDTGKVNVANASGAFILTTGDKTLVGLGYIPNQFDNTLGYAMGDILFFEGINYRARVAITMPTSPAVLANPDDDPTNWESLGGGGVQLVDGTGPSEVTIEQRGKLKISGQAEITDQGAMSDQADIFIPGADPSAFNLFSKGTMELAVAADYTASGGTFTIAEGAALRGTRSANWSLPSSGDTLTSPTIDIPVGYRGKLVEFSMIYKSEGPATLTIRDGSTNLQVIDLEAFTDANGSKKIRTFQQLGGTQSTINFVITAGAGITAFNFDDVVITDSFNSAGQLTNVKRHTFTHEPSSTNQPSKGSTDDQIFDWNADVTAVVEGSGTPLLSYSRTAANGSVWTAQEDCTVSGFYSYIQDSTGNGKSGWSVNSNQLTTGIQSITASNVVGITYVRDSDGPTQIPLSFELKVGDVLRCHADGSATREPNEWRLYLEAEKIETQDVTVYNAQTSAANEFSARLTIVGTDRVLSSSAPFIESINISNMSSQIQGVVVNFVPGFFREIPVVSLLAEGPSGAASIIGIRDSISTSSASFQISGPNGNNQEDSQVSNFAMTVSRQGDDVRSQTANFTIPAISASENVFSARIENDTGTPSITTQSSNFIASVVSNGTGVINYTFVPGMFSVVPVVLANVNADTGNNIDAVEVLNVSTTGFTTETYRDDAGSLDNTVINRDVFLAVHRQGTDYTAPEKIDVPTIAIETISNVENTFTAALDGINDTIISDRNNIISTFTAQADSGFTVTYNAGIFTEAPNIDVQVREPANSRQAVVQTSTATGMTFRTYDHQGTQSDATEVYITWTKQGADYIPPEKVTFQTPLIIPGLSIGTIENSILTEGQFISNKLDGPNWRLCDGRDITGTALATLTGINTAPDMRGRYLAMAGSANSLTAKVLNATLASEVKAADVALTDPGHTHVQMGSSVIGSQMNIVAGTNGFTAGFNSTASSTTGITISAGDETRPETYVVNTFVKVD